MTMASNFPEAGARRKDVHVLQAAPAVRAVRRHRHRLGHRRPRPARRCWPATASSACWCSSATTASAATPTPSPAPATSGTWACTTSAQVGRARRHCARIFDRLTDGRLQWAELPEVYDPSSSASAATSWSAGSKALRRAARRALPQRARRHRALRALVKATARAARAPASSTRALPAPPSPRLGAPLVRRDLRRARGPHHARGAGASSPATRSSSACSPASTATTACRRGAPASPSTRRWSAHYLGGGVLPGGRLRRSSPSAHRARHRGARRPPRHVGRGRPPSSSRTARRSACASRRARSCARPCVISDAGVANTFGRLVPEARARPRGSKPLDHGAAVGRRTSALYLGLPGTPTRELGLTGTNLWLYPDAHHDQNVARFERDPDAPLPDGVLLASLRRRTPTSQRRHPGRATVDVITMARWDWFSRVAGHALEEARRRLRGLEGAPHRSGCWSALYARLPQLRGKVDARRAVDAAVRRATSPGTRRASSTGSTTRPRATACRSAPRTPIDGLFLTGADLASCGVAGAVLGGLLTAGAIVGPKAVFNLVRR